MKANLNFEKMRQERPAAKVVLDYFETHPDAQDSFRKATFAFHNTKEQEGAHYFPSSQRWSKCIWCGRNREEVRWDDLPPECMSHQEPPDIEAVITAEEKSAFALIAKAETHVPQLVGRMGLSGKTLAILHHTHGYPLETVEAIISGITSELKAAYEQEMEAERFRSRASRTPQIITVKNPS